MGAIFNYTLKTNTPPRFLVQKKDIELSWEEHELLKSSLRFY
jgi:hypothetical protein